MTINDISLPISPSLVVWPGDLPVAITQPSHVDRGDEVTVSWLELGSHTGTHVDAPAHFIRDGATVGALGLETLVGPALVVHVGDEVRRITADVLAQAAIPLGTRRLLLRTRNSALWVHPDHTFATDFVAVTEDGARWLVERGVALVGIDYLSIGPYGDAAPTHHVLLERGIVIVEGLNLAGIAPGTYQLVCLPLKLEQLEGAPARAILVE